MHVCGCPAWPCCRVPCSGLWSVFSLSLSLCYQWFPILSCALCVFMSRVLACGSASVLLKESFSGLALSILPSNQDVVPWPMDKDCLLALPLLLALSC